ncbi:TPA: HIT domain-containing protein [Candidatus Geothermarchaeota archaeon]|nr:HIT domain-containing protein [Candidatus Geothermarchaeota archaeon]HIQ13745.1 HIT domain-containing protein [Thermoprotei archaeon]
MKRLWAPWRIEYIKKPKEKECLFCRVPKEDNDRENLLLHRGEKAYIILNRYPYNNGHLMIAPYKHVATPLDLDKEEDLEISNLLRLCIKILDDVMKPQGYNIGANIGRAAGAGIEEHYHIHIVPRWFGDTNYMPILADTKVIVEYLYQTYDNLHKSITKALNTG